MTRCWTASSKDFRLCCKAYKLQEKAAKVGFDWDKDEDVLAKLDEEWQEFQEALQEQDGDHAEEEAGDVLFVFANVCRHFHIEPECALHRANSKFSPPFFLTSSSALRNRAVRGTSFSLDELGFLLEGSQGLGTARLRRRGIGWL